MFQFNKNLPIQAKFALNLNNCQGAVFQVRLSSDLFLFGLSKSVLYFRISCQQIKNIFFHFRHQKHLFALMKTFFHK